MKAQTRPFHKNKTAKSQEWQREDALKREVTDAIAADFPYIWVVRLLSALHSARAAHNENCFSYYFERQSIIKLQINSILKSRTIKFYTMAMASAREPIFGYQRSDTSVKLCNIFFSRQVSKCEGAVREVEELRRRSRCALTFAPPKNWNTTFSTQPRHILRLT